MSKVYPSEFRYDNLMIQTNMRRSAYKYGARKLLFLCSLCIYLKFFPQPMKEEFLPTGKLESANEPYTIAYIFFIGKYNNSEIINIVVGEDITIRELSVHIKEVVGYEGSVAYDSSNPDRIPRKLLDVSTLNALGWKAKSSLKDGIVKTYTWFVRNNVKDYES